MTRTLKQLDIFANALKTRLDTTDRNLATEIVDRKAGDKSYPADALTEDEVAKVKALLATITPGGGGGTPPPSPTAPSAPTSLTASAGDTVADLSWTPPLSSGYSPVTSYHVYRDGTPIATVGVVLSYHDTGLTNGATYVYTVAAINAVGEGSVSPSASATPTASPTPPALTIAGFGLNALSGLGTRTAEVSDAAGFLSAFKRLGLTLDIITFPSGFTGVLDLGAQINRIDGRSGFLIDGTGASVSFTNGPLWFEGCHHFANFNVRHRGGWQGGQAADDFTYAGGAHDFASVNVSTSGAADEGQSTTRSSYNYTYQDCLWGPGQSGHNFGSLNDYLTDRGSHIRSTFVGMEYRCPKVGYYGDTNTGASPANITADVVNRVVVDCAYGLTASSGARVNDTNPYNQNVSTPVERLYGAVVGGQSVPSWAAVTPMTATAAKDYAKTHAGCLPHDSFDAALVGRIA